MSANLCPCCGKPFDGPRSKALIILQDRNEVYFKGKHIDLPVMKAKLLTALAKAQGRYVSREFLTSVIYPNPRDEPVTNTLTVHLAQLRRALRPLGLVIAGSRWDIGWMLTYRGAIHFATAPELVQYWREQEGVS